MKTSQPRRRAPLRVDRDHDALGAESLGAAGQQVGVAHGGRVEPTLSAPARSSAPRLDSRTPPPTVSGMNTFSAVGGGVREPEDVRRLLRAGADKVALNSAAVRDPDLLSRCADRYGAQCVVIAIDVKRSASGWEVFVDAGRTAIGRDAVAWAAEATAERGAGEILLTSMDRDGTGQGYDIELLVAVRDATGVPVIASGGAGELEHFAEGLRVADAVLAASRFHDGALTIALVKDHLADEGIPVRR